MAEVTGSVAFVHNDEQFHTFYKIIGDLQSGVRPLIVLHGGPGISHHYMLPHALLASYHHVPVIFYDQIGVGESSHPKGKPASFWSMDLFMDQLDGLLLHLGVHDDFDLLGHSWGGDLAGQYAAVRCPRSLRHLVIASACAAMELWLIWTNALLDRFPPGVRDMVRRCEREGRTDEKEYARALQIFFKKHICSLDPLPPELQLAFEVGNKDTTSNDVLYVLQLVLALSLSPPLLCTSYIHNLSYSVAYLTYHIGSDRTSSTEQGRYAPGPLLTVCTTSPRRRYS